MRIPRVTVESLGWEADGDQDISDIDTYFYYGKHEIYMLTTSSEYDRIILKGARASENVELFRGRVQDLPEVMTNLRIE